MGPKILEKKLRLKKNFKKYFKHNKFLMTFNSALHDLGKLDEPLKKIIKHKILATFLLLNLI